MKVLILSGRLLYPTNTGARIRSARLFEQLARIHDVTIACFKTASDGADELQQMRASCSRLETIEWTEHAKFSPGFWRQLALNLFSPHPYTVAKYVSPRMQQRLRELLGSGAYDVLVCDFVQPAMNALELPFRPKILFQHNVESVIRKRHYRQTRNPLVKAYLFWEWVRLHRYEGNAARRFDHCIMVSDEDCRTMARLYGIVHTSAIPAGVDAEYFQPGGPEIDGHHIVFTGSMDWLPNVDAVQFFAREVLPSIRRELDATFWIVGREPTAAVRRLGDESPHVKVTGTVSDVRSYVDRAGVYVVPLRIGSGTRIKIFEAMAMGKPVVSTRVGAEGLPVSHGTDILIADDAASIARETIALLRDPVLRRRIGGAGRRLVADHYTWDGAARKFSDICETIALKGRPLLSCA
jgi:sugar transferase (PEP-CTERM/EpsH1 system associated)